DGFALIEGGGTALVELAATTRETGARIAAAVDAGAEVVLVCAGENGVFDGGVGAVEAIEDGGGLRGVTLVVLCETRDAWGARGSHPTGASVTTSRDLAQPDPGDLRRDPSAVPMTAAGCGIAGALWARYDATLVPGPAF